MAENQNGDQPENKTPDLDALLAQLNDGWDKRFQGFQGLLDRRDAEYRQMLDDLRSADLSPEEREQEQSSKLQRERDELRRQVELLSMRKEYPDEVDFVSEFLKKGSYQEQLALLREFRKAQAPSAPGPDEGEAAGEGKPTPVDVNNPKRTSQPDLGAAAERMNKELADQILNASGGDKGILARLRKQG